MTMDRQNRISPRSSPPRSPLERLAILEYHTDDLTESIRSMHQRLDEIAARLWMLDGLETLYTHCRSQVLAILGRAAGMTLTAILVYAAAQTPWGASLVQRLLGP